MSIPNCLVHLYQGFLFLLGDGCAQDRARICKWKIQETILAAYPAHDSPAMNLNFSSEENIPLTSWRLEIIPVDETSGTKATRSCEGINFSPRGFLKTARAPPGVELCTMYFLLEVDLSKQKGFIPNSTPTSSNLQVLRNGVHDTQGTVLACNSHSNWSPMSPFTPSQVCSPKTIARHTLQQILGKPNTRRCA
jgi:hypothetical protein